MSVITPNETARGWKASKHEPAVRIYLSAAEGVAAELAAAGIGGSPVVLTILPAAEPIKAAEVVGAAAVIIEVKSDDAGSVDRLVQLAASTQVPIIAASHETPLSLVRTLLRAGARDVVPLPLDRDEVEAALASIGGAPTQQVEAAPRTAGKLVTFMKSVGGVGTTALLTQVAIRFAEKERRNRREVCLIDLDVQFGDAAFQLGLQPKFSLNDLLEAGTRLDGDLLRATTIEHASGLKIIAAPSEMTPLEGIAGDHLLEIVETATHEFRTVFVDLPTNWTNWSLSLVARSDLVVLVTELTVAGLNRARRQLDLLKSQDLQVEVHVIVNRYDRAMARTISLDHARKVLGREIARTIENDFPLMRSAIDRGVPLHEIKRKSKLAKDLDELDESIAAVLGLER